MAGGVNRQTNQSYYLYNNVVYWTMSPCHFYSSGNSAFVFSIYSGGTFGNWGVSDTNGVRPVINLAYDVEITGTGTSSDPFTVVGAE